MNSNTSDERMTAYLKKIATGPHLSKDLTFDEAQDGMRLILNKEVPDVQAGVFLVALRMKRETDDEHRGILSALREATLFETANLSELVEIADPYDGFKRHLPTSPFLLPLLAACGLPAISHGCEQVGPKFGVTHKQIFSAAGVAVDLTPQKAAVKLANPRIGWAYLDQSVFCPALHDLIELRRLIVKRPAIATLEKMCGPVRAKKNHLWIGYVHAGYDKQIPMAARHAGYDSCVTVLGVEGGVLLPMHKSQTAAVYRNQGEDQSIFLDPKEAGIETNLQYINPSSDCKLAMKEGAGGHALLAKEAVQMGLAALSGGRGSAYDSLVYSAAVFLYAIGRSSSLGEAAKFVSEKLDSGAAFKRFRAGMK
ncbi:MAG: anthranilate phosphoribosyltransferase [Nitrospirota bacterium]